MMMMMVMTSEQQQVEEVEVVDLAVFLAQTATGEQRHDLARHVLEAETSQAEH